MALAGFAMAAVNTLWQSALLVLLAGLLLRLTRPSASGHAAVWTAVLFASTALLPMDLAFERTARIPIPSTLPHASTTNAKAAPAPIPLAVLSGPARSAGTAR